MKQRFVRQKSKEMLKHPENTIFEDGYGQTPKKVMCKHGISIEAKGIYAYLCSYAGGGNTAYPGVEKICRDMEITRKRYYKHFQQVIDAGYIKKSQIIGEDGKFSHNVYEFVYRI